MKFYLFLSALILATFSLNGQDSLLDSLEAKLNICHFKDTTRVNCLNEIAEVLFAHKDEKAVEYAQQAISLAHEIAFSKGLMLSYNNLANHYRKTNNLPKALDLYQLAIDEARRSSNQQMLAYCLRYKSVVLTSMGQLDSALVEQQESIVLCRQMDDQNELAQGLTSLGIIYIYKSLNTPALESFKEAYALFETLGDKQGIARNLNAIGVVCFYMDDMPQAIEYYKKALVINQELDEKVGIANQYTNLGNIYDNLGEDAKAVDYHQKALDIRKELGNQRLISESLYNVGLAYRDMGQYAQAEVYLKDALALSVDLGTKQTEGKCIYSLATIYQSQNKMQKTYDYSKQAYDIGKAMGDIRMLKKSTFVLSAACNDLGRYKEAYDYQLICTQMFDSLFVESNVKEVTNLRNEFEFELEKQAIAAEQTQKEALHESEMRYQKKVSHAFLGGLLMFLLLAIVIFRIMITKRQANLVLAQQKEEILFQAEQLEKTNRKLVDLSNFKEDMTNMLVHDLKNPISAILNVEYIEDVNKRFEVIKHTGFSMQTLVQNILDVYKYNHVGMELKKTTIEIQEVLQIVLHDLDFAAKHKAVIFSYHQSHTMSLSADVEILKRIFINILSNALKFAPTKSTITTSVEMLKEGVVKISFHNQGPHIPKEKQSTIFEKFGQGEIRSHGRMNSTGLGLTFCQMAVASHGGEIGVESEEGQGVMFWLTLPGVTETTQTSQEDKGTRKELLLNDLQIQSLQELASVLKGLTVNELTSFRKVYKQLEQKNLGTKEWRNALEQSVYSCDQAQFDSLVDMVISPLR